MQAIRLERHGEPAVLQLTEQPEPEPAAGELRIRVAAAGINFADILARQGIYPDCPPLPCIIGYEAAGVVDAIGDEVDPAWLGREVMALTDFCAYAEAVCVAVPYVWEKPANLSFTDAVAIPLNGITAWALLVAMGALHAGETILIHNAGGGVGLAAVDIARHRGATIIGTASAGKHAQLLARGVDHCVDYRQDDWETEVMALTGGRGVELAIDPIGGGHWRRSYRLLRKSGRLGMYGISSASAPGILGKLGLLRAFAAAPLFHPAQLIPGNRGVFGVNIHGMYEEHERFGQWMGALLQGVADGWLRPQVDRCFRFSEVAKAHSYIEQRRNVGKVVLVP